MKTPNNQIEASSSLQKKTEPFFTPTSDKNRGFFNSGSAFAPTIQTKLSIGQAGDQYEQEADTMADHVVQQSKNPSPAIQTKCAACEDDAQMKPAIQKMGEEEEEAVQMKPTIQKMGEEEEEAVQMKPAIQKMGEEEEEAVQMKPAIQKMESHGAYEEMERLQTKPQIIQAKEGTEASPELESQLNASKGGGSALPSGTLQEMNQAFGADFSGVRVHNDSSAIQMNQELGAQAFTNGNNVYFNQGKFNPESSEGKHLLAHELTHTIHQGAVEKEGH